MHSNRTTTTTTHTPRNCFAWTLVTLLIITFLTASAIYYFGAPKTDDTRTLQSWEQWRKQGTHVVQTKEEHAALALAIDDHDRSHSSLKRSLGHSPVHGIHSLHRSKHQRRRERRKKNLRASEKEKKEKESGEKLTLVDRDCVAQQ